MSDSESDGPDILGIKPLAKSIHHVTKVSADGLVSFLGKICNPAAKEFGLLLQDKVKQWRTQNALSVVSIAKQKHEENQIDESYQVNPRLAFAVLQQGSWCSEDAICAMWGGLLASSCSPRGEDDGNLIFLNTLSQLTSLQVRVLNYACQSVTKKIMPPGLIDSASRLIVNMNQLFEIAGSDDLHRLDRELDHLRSLELLVIGIQSGTTLANLTPTAFALNFYVRCQGYVGSPLDFFGLIPAPIEGTSEQHSEPPASIGPT